MIVGFCGSLIPRLPRAGMESDHVTEPTCCPDAYYCPASREMECPRHGGFDDCCDRPEHHLGQAADEWHEQQESAERAWLDQFRRTGSFDLEPTPSPVLWSLPC
jgi:hypothetical protein